MRARALLLLPLAAAACDNAGDGFVPVLGPTATTALVVTGALPFTASYAAAVEGDATCPVAGVPTAVHYLAVLASDQPGLCQLLQQGQARAGSRSIVLGVIQTGSGPISPGTYAVAAAPAGAAGAFLSVWQLDAACTASVLPASYGPVTLTATSGGRVQGNVQVALTGGGEVSGTFDAEPCAGAAAADVCAGAVSSTAPACVP
jgi:hypothetical protein